MPETDEFSDYPRLDVSGKKKILGLNAAKLYGLDVPAQGRIADSARPAAQDAAAGVHPG
jgi:hypothetical protein